MLLLCLIYSEVVSGSAQYCIYPHTQETEDSTIHIHFQSCLYVYLTPIILVIKLVYLSILKRKQLFSLVITPWPYR